MTHQAIEQNEIIERYARNRLSAEEKRAFEEHYFACDECFEQVQTMERLLAGTRFAAATGLLAGDGARGVEPAGFAARLAWLKPALVMAVAASLLLAAAALWLWLYQAPRLRDELARERARSAQASEALNQAQADLSQTQEQLQAAREQSARLAASQQPAQPTAETGSVAALEANLPLVMLEATRGQETAELRVPRASQNVVLWIESIGEQFENFRLEIYAADGRLVQSLAGVRRNQYGAIAVSVPARTLPSGSYLVKLFGATSGQSSPAGEFRLRVRKP